MLIFYKLTLLLRMSTGGAGRMLDPEVVYMTGYM